MRKILPVFVLFLFALEAFAGGRPIQIIRCVDRGMEDIALFRISTLKAAATADTTNHVCYPAALTIAGLNPADICVGDASTVHTITITGVDSLMPGDAITIANVENLVFVEDGDNLVGNLTDPSVRTAFTATDDGFGNGTVEIEFTRPDPMAQSKIIFASAVITGSADKTLIIPACTTLTPINTIPTMGEWGLMSLGLILLIFGVIAIRQSILRQSHSIR